MGRPWGNENRVCAVGLLATLLVVLLGAGPGRPGAMSAALPEWRGGYFEKRHGGLFVRIRQAGFAASKQTGWLTGTVQVTLFSRLRKLSMVAAVSPTDRGMPREIFKITAGKYEVERVEMVDTAGVRRRWEPGGDRPTVVVKRQSLSNLGEWTVSPAGRDGLSVKMESVPNPYKEQGDLQSSAVAAVFDGLSGVMQEKIAGRAALEGAEDDYSSGRELRAAATFTRQIEMIYRLNLFKHNYHARKIADVLDVYDPNLRRCYTDLLEDKEDLAGEVRFTFLLSKESGTMKQLKHTGGSAAEPRLATCLFRELGHLQFPVPETMIGELTYTFGVR